MGGKVLERKPFTYEIQTVHILDINPLYRGIVFNVKRYMSVEEVDVAPKDREKINTFTGDKAYLFKSKRENPEKNEDWKFEIYFDKNTGHLAKTMTLTNDGRCVYEKHYMDYQVNFVQIHA